MRTAGMFVLMLSRKRPLYHAAYPSHSRVPRQIIKASCMSRRTACRWTNWRAASTLSKTSWTSFEGKPDASSWPA